MTERPENPTTIELLDRIIRLETSVSRLCDRIEALELHNVEDYYNRQIDQKLDEYAKKNPNGKQFDKKRYADDPLYRQVIDEEIQRTGGQAPGHASSS